MAKTYTPVGWEAGELVSPAMADLTTGEVTPAVYSGATPVNVPNLKHMDDAIKSLYDEGASSKDIYIGPEEEAPEDAKIVIDPEQMAEPIAIENNSNVYSTEEIQIGWLAKEDGTKTPLYRRMLTNISVVKGSTADAGYTRIDLPYNIDEIFVKYAEVIESTSKNKLTLPYIFGDGKVLRISSVYSTNIMIANNSSLYGGTGSLIIEYTKKTS